METILKKVKENMILFGGKNIPSSGSHTKEKISILAAFSGGIDSRCLLDLLMELREELNLDISAAYVNHNLRNMESDEEEKFVTKLADELGLVFYKKTIEKDFWSGLKHESVEMAARRIRYDFFHSTARENNISLIATAHNLNDNIETFFLKVLRAGGVDTLSSIPFRNGNIIRPLLNITRAEIENHVKLKNLAFIEDSSNKKNIYKRNIIRNRIIPVLSEIQPGVEGNFEKIFGFFREENEFVNSTIDGILDSIAAYRSETYYAVIKEEFNDQVPFVKKHVIKAILKKIGYPAKPDKFMFVSLLSGKKTSYNKNGFQCVERGHLIWFINKNKIGALDEEIIINDIPFNYQNRYYKIEAEKEFNVVPGKGFSFDFGKVKFPVILRRLKKNDVMKTSTEMSVSKILKNMKIPSILFPEVIIAADLEKTIGFILNDITCISKDFYFEKKSEIFTLHINKTGIII